MLLVVQHIHPKTIACATPFTNAHLEPTITLFTYIKCATSGIEVHYCVRNDIFAHQGQDKSAPGVSVSMYVNKY